MMRRGEPPCPAGGQLGWCGAEQKQRGGEQRGERRGRAQCCSGECAGAQMRGADALCWNRSASHRSSPCSAPITSTQSGVHASNPAHRAPGFQAGMQPPGHPVSRAKGHPAPLCSPTRSEGTPVYHKASQHFPREAARHGGERRRIEPASWEWPARCRYCPLYTPAPSSPAPGPCPSETGREETQVH